MLTTCCPVPTVLASVVTAVPCPENFGQIQKLVFWRSGNTIGSVATAELEGTWTVLLAATGDTKALVSPFVAGASITPGEVRQYGGGNDTIDGVPIIMGSEPSVFEGRMLQYSQETISKLRALACEDLEVIFINENGEFGYRLSGTDDVAGFPIKGFFVSDMAVPGYAEPSYNSIRFMIPAGNMGYWKTSSVTDFALTMLNS